MSKLLEIKAQVTSGEWLLFRIKMGEARLCPFRDSLSLGKEVTPRRGRGSAAHIVQSASEWTAPQAPSFLPSPRPGPALRRRGKGQGPGPADQLWGETGPLAPSGAALGPTAGQDPCPSERPGWDSTATGGDVPARRSPLHTWFAVRTVRPMLCGKVICWSFPAAVSPSCKNLSVTFDQHYHLKKKKLS